MPGWRGTSTDRLTRVTAGAGLRWLREAAVDFAETDEHRALRAAVAAIARDFGPAYYTARAAERKPCDEL